MSVSALWTPSAPAISGSPAALRVEHVTKRFDAGTAELTAGRAYETVAWMFQSPDAAKVYAEFAGVSERLVPRPRAEFFPNGAIFSERITGTVSLMAGAVRFRFIASPLSEAQLAELMQ